MKYYFFFFFVEPLHAFSGASGAHPSPHLFPSTWFDSTSKFNFAPTANAIFTIFAIFERSSAQRIGRSLNVLIFRKSHSASRFGIFTADAFRRWFQFQMKGPGFLFGMFSGPRGGFPDGTYVLTRRKWIRKRKRWETSLGTFLFCNINLILDNIFLIVLEN